MKVFEAQPSTFALQLDIVIFKVSFLLKDERNCAYSSWTMWEPNRREGKTVNLLLKVKFRVEIFSQNGVSVYSFQNRFALFFNSFGKLFQMNMALIPLVLTTEILTFNWKESTFITTKRPVCFGVLQKTFST